MDKAFRNIVIMGRLEGEPVHETLEQLVRHLQSRNINVLLEQDTATLLDLGLQSVNLRQVSDAADLVIVVGGDGCLLRAGRALAKQQTPVLGVNRGQLGFLTDISPQSLNKQIDAILSGRYTIEERFLLDCWVRRDNHPIGNGDALNDVVVHPSHAVQMIEFDLFIEGQFVYTLRSEGLIVATPTGSTAYALSAGGPIMQPSLDAMVLVPMYPHALSSKPLVVAGNSEIKIVIKPNRHHDAPQLSFDGQSSLQLAVGDVVRIHKKPQRLKLLHPLDHNFYEACRSKLGWSLPWTQQKSQP